MDVTPAVLEILRLVASEFSGIGDEVINKWIELTAPLVSRKRFGNLYTQALALYTAHRMKLANINSVAGEDLLGDIGKIGVGSLMRVSNISEGGVSVGFNSGASQSAGTDAELALTEYGVQYLSLRRLKIIPIISAGENYVRA